MSEGQTTADQAKDTQPATQPDAGSHAQKASEQARRYRQRAKQAEAAQAAAEQAAREQADAYEKRIAELSDHIGRLRHGIAADTIRSLNERRLTPDGHSTEPAYVHSPDGEPIRREMLEMVLASLDTQLGGILDVEYADYDKARRVVHRVSGTEDLFERDADGNPTDSLNMQAVKALLRVLGRMDGFKAPPSKPKATMPTISSAKPSRPAASQSVLAYAVPRAIRPYQRDPNIWPRC